MTQSTLVHCTELNFTVQRHRQVTLHTLMKDKCGQKKRTARHREGKKEKKIFTIASPYFVCVLLSNNTREAWVKASVPLSLLHLTWTYCTMCETPYWAHFSLSLSLCLSSISVVSLWIASVCCAFFLYFAIRVILSHHVYLVLRVNHSWHITATAGDDAQKFARWMQ